jgi:hypothetical protein
LSAGLPNVFAYVKYLGLMRGAVALIALASARIHEDEECRDETVQVRLARLRDRFVVALEADKMRCDFVE